MELTKFQINPFERALYEGDPIKFICNNGADTYHQGTIGIFLRMEGDAAIIKLGRHGVKGEKLKVYRHQFVVIQATI